jgi:hypothetical protein
MHPARADIQDMSRRTAMPFRLKFRCLGENARLAAAMIRAVQFLSMWADDVAQDIRIEPICSSKSHQAGTAERMNRILQTEARLRTVPDGDEYCFVGQWS